MTENTKPKVIINEDYLDLRKYPDNNLRIQKSKISPQKKLCGQSKAIHLNREGLKYERELINSGLKKLATTYYATANLYHRRSSPSGKRKPLIKEKSMIDPRFRRSVIPEERQNLKSQSEFSVLNKKCGVEKISPSTPVLKSMKSSHDDVKIESVKNRGTMTKEDKCGKIMKCRKHRSKSKDCEKKPDMSISPKDYVVNQALNHYLDPRLCEKYSVLKMPWKRTWTLPVFSPKSTTKVNENDLDTFDRQTYLYDDGTEIDSVYVEEKQKQFFSTALQNQCMALLFLAGSICGILLVSLLIWFIFGNNFFNIFFKPRKITEGTFKRYIKYIGGGIIHVVTTFFQTLGKVLAIPTQKVYHSQPEHYRWPLNPSD